MISIHAPHTGRDCPGFRGFCGAGYFNPRAPYGARLVPCYGDTPAAAVFQSTRPIRGATSGNNRLKLGKQNFNPRAPYGARLIFSASLVPCYGISIHAPHTGRDPSGQFGYSSTTNFNPRAPYGARLCCLAADGCVSRISIHAPHTGRDYQYSADDVVSNFISIHAPHTGRDRLIFPASVKPFPISIHAPHTGRDSTIITTTFRGFNFNPRAPYGARRDLTL